MIKIFRTIRYDLMKNGKIGRYFKYAIGEIILVVIGIMIALWLNNMNQERIESKERQILKTALIAELNNNKEAFNSYKSYADNCSNFALTILNISAGEPTDLPIDTIRKYAVEMFPSRTLRINESQRKSMNSAGQLDLLTSEERKALAEYEAVLESYKEARRINTIWKESNRKLFLNLAIFEPRINSLKQDKILVQHPDYNLNDEAFMIYLKDRETYAKLKDVFISTLVDVNWLESVLEDIESTIETLKQ